MIYYLIENVIQQEEIFMSNEKEMNPETNYEEMFENNPGVLDSLLNSFDEDSKKEFYIQTLLRVEDAAGNKILADKEDVLRKLSVADLEDLLK